MDYQAIIDEFTTEDMERIMRQLDIEYEDKGNAYVMPTYCHNPRCNEASHKLYYYKNNKCLVCYSECGSMSVFKFLKQYYETQEIDYDWHRDILGLIRGDREQTTGFVIPKYKSIVDKYQQNTAPALPHYNEGVLDCFQTHYYAPEWLSDHIAPASMDKFNIRYSISQNKIIIPHYDIDSNLCGIRGRALNPEEIEIIGKYAPVKIEGTWYSHPLSLNLYGLNFNKPNITQRRIAFLVESEKSVMQADSFSSPNCVVATCGSNLNIYQVRLLIKNAHPDEIVVCYDNEELPGEEKYFNKLYKICKKYSAYCKFSFVYDRAHLTPNKASPTDCGEEIFTKLITHRIEVR